MQGKRLLAVVAAGAALSGAVDARAADVRGVEVRPGVPGLEFTANAGEANDLTLVNKTSVSTASPGAVGGHTIVVVDDGAPLTTGGTHPCVLLSVHKARCVAFDDTYGAFWATIEVQLYDGPDRVRMPSRIGYPFTTIYTNGGGGSYTLRGPDTWVWGANTGDRVRFRPPGGGGVILGGSPRLWLVDGAQESLDCRTPGDPQIFADPLDDLGSCQ